MQKEKKWWKNFSTFQIVAFILTILFVIGTIVTIAILINLKNKIDDTKDKNDQLENIMKDKNQDTDAQSWMALYEKQITDFI